ncbi:MAG: hypothetical protein ACLS20_09655 [Faecalimonas umbilicata]
MVIGVIATGVMLNVADIRQTPKMVMKEYFELLSKGKYERRYAFVSDISQIERKLFIEKTKIFMKGSDEWTFKVKFDKEKKKKDKEKTACVYLIRRRWKLWQEKKHFTMKQVWSKKKAVTGNLYGNRH